VNLKNKLLLLACLLVIPPSIFAEPTDKAQALSRQLSIDNQPWFGDFDQMVDRTLIRVLVPYSRTFYFHDKGHARGLTADLVRDFERHINKKYAKQLHKRPVTVVIVPTTRERLLDDLGNGLGDIAAGNLTETTARLEQVDFFAPDDRQVSELILTGPSTLPIQSIDELSGATVHVRKSSSYFQSLTALNQRFHERGKTAIKIVTVPDAIEDEDLMEMLNAGVISIMIADDWKAKIWAQVLPKITVTNLAIREAGHSGWAMRKQSPELKAEVMDFYVNNIQKLNLLEKRLQAFNKQIKQIIDNTADKDWQRFENIQMLFEKYGELYSFDPLMLAAQGYQESMLRQETRGPSGAIGVMQVLPSTAKVLRVGDIKLLEPNIHAGAKYLDELMSSYFSDANFQGDDRTLFAFASYNAGPGTINRMRKEAVNRGLNPDRWFNHVELVVADKVGWETTTYVRNIYKYYVAYKLQLEVAEHQRQARLSVSMVN
jgi:membrane-bound lytic murein transglycosylase MltF